MKFLVGYQLMQTADLLNEIIKCKTSISEVYFSWGDFANGRNNQLRQSSLTPWEAQKRQEADLALLAQNGIGLNLLFNATCYGKDSQSREFFHKIGTTVDYIQSHYVLKGVTTTSPLIAKFIQSNFENLDVRASVNMGIGTIEGMDYVSEYFDSFYLKRELNRDFVAISRLKKWCDDNGKKLYGLANSGCLNNCSAHIFHDNLVSHESEIDAMDNGYVFEGICRKHLGRRENYESLLSRTGFIRPEDMVYYEELFSATKLATRVSPCPVRILQAYIQKQSYCGNMLDLLEPNHAGLLYPYILDNDKIKSTVEEGWLIYSNLEEALIRLADSL